MKVLGISGSLRKNSFNTAALRAARELAPDGMAIEFADLSAVPPYDGDVEAQGLPEAVVTLRRQIAEADALLIATPEYNYSIAGVLKNAIDWASRPPEQPFDGKPIAVLGASPGRLGTARAQYHLRQVFITCARSSSPAPGLHHLRQVFVFLNGRVLNRPEVMIAAAGQAFDGEGRLVDEAARELIAQQLQALREWAGRLAG